MADVLVGFATTYQYCQESVDGGGPRFCLMGHGRGRGRHRGTTLERSLYNELLIPTLDALSLLKQSQYSGFSIGLAPALF